MKDFEKEFEENFDKDFKKTWKDIEEKLQKFDEKVVNKLDGLDKVIEEKVSATLGKVSDTFKSWKTRDMQGATENSAEKDDDGADKNSSFSYEYTSADKGDDGYWEFHTKDGVKHVKPKDMEGSTDKKREEDDDFAKKIEKLAPFLDDDTLHDIVREFVDGELDVDMVQLLPFLDEAEIGLLMKKLYTCEGETFKGLKVADLLPFADEDEISEIFLKRARNGVIDKEMLPFVSDKYWHKIVVEYCRDENSKLDIDEAYPYLDDEDIALIFKTYLKRRKRK